MFSANDFLLNILIQLNVAISMERAHNIALVKYWEKGKPDSSDPSVSLP
jgi:hypothetical protein